MAYCYCCIYGEMIEVGTYKCRNPGSFECGEEQADVSSCFDFTYDDCFDETGEYPSCYLKDICYEKHCEWLKNGS